MSHRTIIIAEAGVNHNGSIELAKKLIDAAAKAGVDFIKFQTFKADRLVSKAAKKAKYQEQNIGDGDDSQFSMLRKLELSEAAHLELVSYCKLRGINFLSTGFDEESVDFLDTLGIPFYKIPSGEITNKPYLAHTAQKGKPVILSTGMATLAEIGAAIDVLKSGGINHDQITILHCNTEYPTPFEDVNLKAMETIRKTFNVRVGYSDHTRGIEVPIAAVALGAEVIEKHFTLDRNMEGPDHKASLEPAELAAMVSAIRNIELATSGGGIKQPSASEMKNISIARKSIHLSKDIPQGSVIDSSSLICLRPGDGISPMEIDRVIGRKVKRELPQFYKLSWEDLE